MESVAGVLRVAEQSVQKRQAYEASKKKRQETLQKLLNEGLINEEDLTRAQDGKLSYCSSNDRKLKVENLINGTIALNFR